MLLVDDLIMMVEEN